MRGFHIAGGVVRGELDRRKVAHFVIVRHNDHAARVLTRGALDARAPFGKALFFSAVDVQVALFQIFFDIAVSGFFRHGGDCARLENVGRTEQLFSVAVRFALVFTGEVQVDIGRFVAVEAEERFERDFVTVANHRRAAMGAVFFRHIKAGTVFAVGIKFGIFTVGATVVGRQGIDLGNPRHCRDKRRTDRTTRTDVVAVVLGIPNQLLRDDIQNGEPVLNNGVQFSVQSCFDKFGHFAVKLVPLARFCPADFAKLLFRPRNGRLVSAVGKRPNDIDHIGDFVGVINNDFACRLFAEIGKFREHFFGRSEIQGCLFVGVGKALRRH